jgi:hypothetical protein
MREVWLKVVNFFVGYKTPDHVELIINISPEDFVKAITEVTDSRWVSFSLKRIFFGTVNEHAFKLYRTKRSGSFDYNVTRFNGQILSDAGRTKIIGTFSISWIFQYNPAIMLFVFGILDYFLVTAKNVTLGGIAIFLLVEVFVLVQTYTQNRVRFRIDKNRYLEILTRRFGKIEMTNPLPSPRSRAPDSA